MREATLRGSDESPRQISLRRPLGFPPADRCDTRLRVSVRRRRPGEELEQPPRVLGSAVHGRGTLDKRSLEGRGWSGPS